MCKEREIKKQKYSDTFFYEQELKCIGTCLSVSLDDFSNIDGFINHLLSILVNEVNPIQSAELQIENKTYRFVSQDHGKTKISKHFTLNNDKKAKLNISITNGIEIEDEEKVLLSFPLLLKNRIDSYSKHENLQNIEEKHASLKKYFENFYEHIRSGLLIYNENGEITNCNQELTNIIGSPKDVLIGLKLFKLPDKKLVNAIKKSLSEANSNYEGWYTSVTANKKAYVKIQFKRINADLGLPGGGIGIVEDLTERKNTEDALRQSESRFKEIFSSVKEGIIYYDTSGNVLYVNDALCQMVDIKKEEIENNNAYSLAKKFVSAKQLPGLIKRLAQSLTGMPIAPFELAFNNRIFEISTNYAKKSKRITSSFRDITLRKSAQEKLIENEKKYRNLFKNAPIGIFQTNHKGEILLINSEMAKILGFSSVKEAMDYYYDIGLQLYKNPAKRSEFLNLIAKNNYVEGFEYEAYTKNKDIVWLNANVRIAGRDENKNIIFEGFITDITQRKEAELALIQQKSLFETMFDAITDGIIITDVNRNILLSNAGMTKTFRYTQGELNGNSTKMIYEDNHQYDTAGNRIYNASNKTKNDFYISIYKRKNNTTFPGETFARKLYDSEGKLIGSLVVIRDVSERQTFISELEQAKQRAEESDKLKSSFLANMSHEIRTPMNGILGFSQMLLKPNLKKEKLHKYADIIVDNSKQLLHIVNDILDISLIEAGQLKINLTDVNISTILHAIEVFYKPQANAKKISLKLKLENNIPNLLHTDEHRLKQILNNLINNAIKFTEHGSVVFGAKADSNWIKFFVKDTGRGISDNQLDYIFERFNQEEIEDHKKLGGTGLGLSISKKLVELLGGDISVESQKGKGSTFYFTIPVLHN
jgi:PAS domain S-box-containing protein